MSGCPADRRPGEHYFSTDPTATSAPVEVTARVWGHQLRLRTDAGVFARGRIDPGTAVLFRATEAPTHPGEYLDLGCGYGVIAVALAATLPAGRVWAVDVNNRALELARHNLACNADNAMSGSAGSSDAAARGCLPTAPLQHRVARPEDVPADLRFAGIWSNPPIHVGKPALHGLLQTWLDRLLPDGTATLVVGRNLGADSLQAWLTEQGWPTRRLASAKGFRVLRAAASATRVAAGR